MTNYDFKNVDDMINKDFDFDFCKVSINVDEDINMVVHNWESVVYKKSDFELDCTTYNRIEKYRTRGFDL